MDALTRGVADAFAGKKLDLAGQQQLTQYVRHVREMEGARNEAVASDYLANNAKAKGVKTTASGLQYRWLFRAKPRRHRPARMTRSLCSTRQVAGRDRVR